ncbi:hypothetical protein BDW59DRAFT_159953 [Aspergillus cavernicola]|uniref:Uncharacterized protein n=1 Tax=Aspergillus cavernicola TaxID=176166 RepID=A0ABR4IJP1_9EURO
MDGGYVRVPVFKNGDQLPIVAMDLTTTAQYYYDAAHREEVSQALKVAFSNQISITSESGSGRMLKKPAGSIIALVFEALLCVVALCFIALGIAALCIRNRPTGDSFGSVMEQAMKLAYIQADLHSEKPA